MLHNEKGGRIGRPFLFYQVFSPYEAIQPDTATSSFIENLSGFTF